MRGIGIFLFLVCVGFNCFAKKIVVGTTNDHPPFESFTGVGQNLYGFDIDLMDEICHRMKAKCSFKAMSYDQVFPAVANGKVDIAIAAITITNERKKQFIFSLPYMNSYLQFLTTSQSKINSTSDITGKKIGVRISTPDRQYLEKEYGSSITIIDYPNMSTIFAALQNNEIDALVMDADTAQFWSNENSGIYKLIGKPMLYGQGYGIMSIKSQQPLIEKINAILLEMEKDGGYLELYSNYFGPGNQVN